jgi:hypothetical protein
MSVKNIQILRIRGHEQQQGCFMSQCCARMSKLIQLNLRLSGIDFSLV